MFCLTCKSTVNGYRYAVAVDQEESAGHGGKGECTNSVLDLCVRDSLCQESMFQTAESSEEQQRAGLERVTMCLDITIEMTEK